MTIHPHNASPVVPGADGADLPGVQAGSPCQSVKRGATNNALGGVEGHAAGSNPAPSVWAVAKVGAADRWNSSASIGAQSAVGINPGPSAPFNDPWCSGSTPKWDHPTGQYQSGCGDEGSIPSGSPFNDCGGVDGHAIRSDWPRRKSGNVVSQAGVEPGPQFPLFIAILFAVPMGCVIWAVLLWWLL